MTSEQRPPAVIDPDTGTVRRRLRIDAPVWAVWAAVTEPAHISRWLGDTVLVDGVGTVSWPDRPGVPLRVEHMSPQHSVSYRWSNDDSLAHVAPALDVSHSTVFTFTLEAVAGGTLLSVVESGFETMSDPDASRESHRRGWIHELDELADLVEAA